MTTRRLPGGLAENGAVGVEPGPDGGTGGFTAAGRELGFGGVESAVTAEERLDTLQAVELAEGVEVQLRVAGPLPRMLAYAIDLLVCLAALLVAGLVLALAGWAIGGTVSVGLWMLAWFLIAWWYPVWFESGRRGATLGKRALGLRVVQTTGVPVTFGQAVVRNFLRFIDIQPIPTGWSDWRPACRAGGSSVSATWRRGRWSSIIRRWSRWGRRRCRTRASHAGRRWRCGGRRCGRW